MKNNHTGRVLHCMGTLLVNEVLASEAPQLGVTTHLNPNYTNRFYYVFNLNLSSAVSHDFSFDFTGKHLVEMYGIARASF